MPRPALILPILLAALSLLAQSNPARAAINWTGDIDPADPTTWTSDTLAYIGKTSTGTLEITDGGAVASRYGYLGGSVGSTGEVSIDGTGSTWTNSDGLSVGCEGSGALEITGGGAVSNCRGTLGCYSGSTGLVSVDAAGSILTNSGTFRVGGLGSGTLIISNGGAVVVNNKTYMGYSSDSTGVISIDGAGSTWTNSDDLYLGYYGSGMLSIAGGGAVSVGGQTFVGTYRGSTAAISFGTGGGTLTTRALLASASQLMGTGTIDTHGLVSDVDLVFDSTHGFTRTFTFDSGPEQNITINLDMSGSSSSNGFLGAGYHGNGSLTIRDGITVSSRVGHLGYHSGSMGVASVDGIGSMWANSNTLFVGGYGNGKLDITGGGVVCSHGGTLSYFFGSTGAVRVHGLGSMWTNSSELHVGHYGNGTLTVTDGGGVNSGCGYLGIYSNSTGVVSVDGPGSTWTSNGRFYVGKSGTGTLQITNGGLVSIASTLTIDWNADGDSFINMSTGGTLALYGDADDSLDDFLELIEGTDAIRYWNGSISDWASITDATRERDYTLTYVDEAGNDLHGYTVLCVTVPEPSVLVLILTALAMLSLRRRK